MAGIKGTKTERNILTAFAGECQASARYGFFAKKAKKEGYEQIAAILERTAGEEMAHASRFYKFLEGGETDIAAVFPAGGNGVTSENLKVAAAAEREEWSRIYPGFAGVARQEGFEPAARVFEAIAAIEKTHETRDRHFADRIESKTVFRREQSVVWRCRKCGYLHQGAEAPAACLACGHPQAYFEVLGEDW